MNLKYFAILSAVAAVAACDKAPGTQNPEMLRGMNYVANRDGVNIALSFDPANNTVHGQVVNLYNGPYTADDNTIEFGNVVSTMMMGPQNAMAVEQEYFQFLRGTQTYEINDNQLIIRNANGQEIVFDQVDVIPDPVNE